MSWIAKDILKAMSELAENNPDVSLDQLQNHTQLERKRIVNSADILVRRGFIDRNSPGRYRLTEFGTASLAAGMSMTSGPKGSSPRKKTWGLRQKAWNVIRNKRKFTLDDIRLTVCQGDERNARSNLGKYIRSLVLSGYLKVLPRKAKGNKPSSNGQQVYLLMNNTGRQAPVWRQANRSVFDPNTKEEYPLPDTKN